MKTNYRFLKNFKSISKLKNFVSENSLKEVKILRKRKEEITFHDIYKFFLADFEFRGSDNNIRFTEYYTSLFACESVRRQKLKLVNANRKFRATISLFEAIHLPYTIRGKRFSYNDMYRDIIFKT